MSGASVVALDLLAIIQSFIWAALAGLAWVSRDHPFPLPYSPAQLAQQTDLAVAYSVLFGLSLVAIAAFALRPWRFGWWTMAVMQALYIGVFAGAILLDRAGYDWQIWSAFAASGGLGVFLLVRVRRASARGELKRE
jgi:hypothetical protein